MFTISLTLAKPGEAILGVHTACTGDPRDKASASGGWLGKKAAALAVLKIGCT